MIWLFVAAVGVVGAIAVLSLICMLGRTVGAIDSIQDEQESDQ
jgi:hypothetical protein